MKFTNTETPTFAGSHGTATSGPDVVETFTLTDRSGNTVATFTKDITGAFAFDVLGGVTQNSLASLTTSTGLRVAHAKYSFAVDGGTQGTITPATSDTIPANAIMVGGTINSTTALTSNGSATLAVGTSAGSSGTSIKTATAKASLSANALLNAVPVFATPVKMTAAGAITVTIGAADLTAGVVEIWVYYVVAAA